MTLNLVLSRSELKPIENNELYRWKGRVFQAISWKVRLESWWRKLSSLTHCFVLSASTWTFFFTAILLGMAADIRSIYRIQWLNFYVALNLKCKRLTYKYCQSMSWDSLILSYHLYTQFSTLNFKSSRATLFFNIFLYLTLVNNGNFLIIACQEHTVFKLLSKHFPFQQNFKISLGGW